MTKSKYAWHRLNGLREERGEERLTWKEFISDSPKPKQKLPKRRDNDPLYPIRRKSFYNFEPEPERKPKIQRPPAKYDNPSVYDKYSE